MTLADLRKRQGIESTEAGDDHGDQSHPSALEYARVGILLAIITAIEIALYYVDVNRNLLIVLLIGLSAVKFLFVVLWFMHLKFDNRLFSTMFAGGFVLALGLFVVVFATLGGKLV